MKKKVAASEKASSSAEFFEALEQLAQLRGIPLEDLIAKIEDGVFKAMKKQFPDTDEEEFSVKIDPEKREMRACIMRTIVDDEPIDFNEINIDEARTIDPNCVVGEKIAYALDPATFGRVAAQYAKQSIRHDVREFEKEKLIAEYQDKVREIVSAEVIRTEPANGIVTVRVGKNEFSLMKNDQIPGEVLKVDDIIDVYIVDIINLERRPTVKLSRVYKDFVRKLFEREVPEIYDGTVEIVSIAREAGSRTKIAVKSNDENVDAVGSCIGPKSTRINNILASLANEKIDIIPYDADPAKFVANALSPAKVNRVEVADSDEKMCTAYVPENELSLAIGNKGQNAKLAARLTGYKIDIKPGN